VKGEKFGNEKGKKEKVGKNEAHKEVSLRNDHWDCKFRDRDMNQGEEKMGLLNTGP